MKNIPVRSDHGKRVKELFVPRPGYVYVSADFSQIDLRVLAHLSNGEMARCFLEGLDLHQRSAEGCRVDRQKAKVINFLPVNGGREGKLAKDFGWDKAYARKVLDLFNTQYPEVEKTFEMAFDVCRSRGYIRTLGGRRRSFPELDDADKWVRAAAERRCRSTLVQGGAADVVKLAMINVHRTLPDDWYMISQIHDELTLEVPKEMAEQAAEELSEIMTDAGEQLGMRVPLVAEANIGNNWLEVK